MDIEKLLNELSKLLSDISDTRGQRRTVVNSSRSRIMGFDISSNISIKIGLAEELKNTPAEQYQQLTDVEPLIDVFDSEDGLKIVVLLPGIKKEDVNVTVIDGKLVIEIRKGFQVYRKEIPCNIREDEIAVKTISNNSVIEMFLARKKVNVGE
ncbi:MAG: HSP20 family molecular chaperone IbpA [Candidatus Nitrosomirales archaeon]|jgi:HSP20 family molecular chaperone IbpA